jgi:RNA polymerase sigma-70 factor (ECF subfamily)
MARMSEVMKGPGNSSDRATPSSGPGSTSESLLDRLKEGDAASWRRFLSLYTHLVLWWCWRGGVRRHDAEEVAQEVFQAVAAKVARFDRRRRGSFRAWLRGITQHKLYAHYRRSVKQPQALGGSEGEELLAGVPVDPPEDSAGPEELTERAILCRRALDLMRSEFDPRTWEAAWRTIAEGQRPADVAAALGMTANAVYIARSRVLARGRELLRELMD